MMNKYVYLSMALTITLTSYLLRNLPLVYGLAFYIVNSIVCLSMVMLYLMFSRESISRIIDNKAIVVYLLLLSIIPRYMIGLVLGFGYNIASLTPIDFILTNIYNLSLVISIELLRRILVNSIVDNRVLRIWIPAIITTILYVSLTRITDYTTQSVVQNASIFLNEVFLTILAITTNTSTQLLYRIPNIILTKTLPILPAIPQAILTPLTILITLMQLTIVYYMFLRNNIVYTGTNMYTSPVRRLLSLTLNASLAILSITLLLLTLNGYRFFIVTSGSMSPQINAGDIIVIDTRVDNIAKGDIISFMVGDKIVTHRVVEIIGNGDNESTYYITKGDANRDIDPWIIRRDNIIGKNIYLLPHIGKPMVALARTTRDYTLLVSILVSIILILLGVYVVREVVRSIG